MSMRAFFLAIVLCTSVSAETIVPTIPLPWTNDEIRQATKPGMKLKFQAYFKDGDTEATVHKLIEILTVSDEGLTIKSTQMYPDGKLTSTTRNPREESYTWGDWANGFGFGNLSFTEDETKVTEERVRVPAGSFVCKVYTTIKIEDEETGDNTTTIWAFVKDKPGQFVKVISTYTEEGESPEIQQMELLEIRE